MLLELFVRWYAAKCAYERYADSARRAVTRYDHRARWDAAEDAGRLARAYEALLLACCLA